MVIFFRIFLVFPRSFVHLKKVRKNDWSPMTINEKQTVGTQLDISILQYWSRLQVIIKQQIKDSKKVIQPTLGFHS